MKLYVTKRQKKDYTYVCLVWNNGIKETILSFDKYIIMTVADITPAKLEALAVGEKINIKY